MELSAFIQTYALAPFTKLQVAKEAGGFLDGVIVSVMRHFAQEKTYYCVAIDGVGPLWVLEDDILDPENHDYLVIQDER